MSTLPSVEVVVVEVIAVVLFVIQRTSAPPLVHCAPYSRGPEWEFWTLRGLAIITALQHFGTRALQHYNTAGELPY